MDRSLEFTRSGTRSFALCGGQRNDIGQKIPAFGFDPSGTLRGKDKIWSYWGTASKQLPNLHFDLIDTYVSPDSIVVF